PPSQAPRDLLPTGASDSLPHPGQSTEPQQSACRASNPEQQRVPVPHAPLLRRRPPGTVPRGLWGGIAPSGLLLAGRGPLRTGLSLAARAAPNAGGCRTGAAV